MSSGERDGREPDGSATDEAPDKRPEPTALGAVQPPPRDDHAVGDGQLEPGKDDLSDFSVRGVDALQWAPDPTAETPVAPHLPGDPRAGAPPGDVAGPSAGERPASKSPGLVAEPPPGAPTASPWDPVAPVPRSPGATDAPSDPSASVFAPATEPTPHPASPPPTSKTPPSPAPPGPLRPPPLRRPPLTPSRPGAAGRAQIRPVILGLAAVGVLLVVGLAVMVLQGDGDDGSDGASGSEGAATDIDDLGEGASLIVGSTGVVGTWSGSEWEARGEGDQPGAGIELSIVGPGEVLTKATGEQGDPVADSCASDGATNHDVRVPLEPGGPDEPPPVAVAGVDDPVPRPVEHFEDSETYQEAAAETARAEGATTPPTVTQVLRMDLDDSGTDEVVVAAEHLSDPDGLAPSPGDWSLVFLRRVVGNEVMTEVLSSSIAEGEEGSLERVQVSAVADVNGDGVMEVVLSGRSASGDWTAVHAAGEGGEAGSLTEVLRATCGS